MPLSLFRSFDHPILQAFVVVASAEEAAAACARLDRTLFLEKFQGARFCRVLPAADLQPADVERHVESFKSRARAGAGGRAPGAAADHAKRGRKPERQGQKSPHGQLGRVVKCDGLPADITHPEIAQLLWGLPLPLVGTHIQQPPPGQAHAQAFLEFEQAQHAALAVGARNGSLLTTAAGAFRVSMAHASRPEWEAELARQQGGGGPGGAAAAAAARDLCGGTSVASASVSTGPTMLPAFQAGYASGAFAFPGLPPGLPGSPWPMSGLQPHLAAAAAVGSMLGAAQATRPGWPAAPLPAMAPAGPARYLVQDLTTGQKMYLDQAGHVFPPSPLAAPTSGPAQPRLTPSSQPNNNQSQTTLSETTDTQGVPDPTGTTSSRDGRMPLAAAGTTADLVSMAVDGGRNGNGSSGQSGQTAGAAEGAPPPPQPLPPARHHHHHHHSHQHHHHDHHAGSHYASSTAHNGSGSGGSDPGGSGSDQGAGGGDRQGSASDRNQGSASDRNGAGSISRAGDDGAGSDGNGSGSDRNGSGGSSNGASGDRSRTGPNPRATATQQAPAPLGPSSTAAAGPSLAADPGAVPADAGDEEPAAKRARTE
eukprot:scaffold2.g6882.t1